MITFLKKQSHDEQLNNLKNYYENIIAKIPGHVYWKNTKGIFLGCNDQQAETLGLSSRNEVVGKTTFDMVWYDQPYEQRKLQAEKIDEVDQQIIQTGTPRVIEEPLVKPDGSVAIYLSNKSPLYDDNNNIIGILGISIDITAQKEAERLQQEKEAAEKRAEYLRAAAGSIAHELRTPLASISFAAQFINDYWDILLNTYKMAQQAGMSVEEINPIDLMNLDGRIDSIIEQTYFSNAFIDLILGNLKEESELNTSAYKVCDIATVVNTCLARYPLSDREKLLINWEPNISFEFNGDEFLMLNVLNNLIKNALYYVKDAGKGKIYITLERKDNANILYFKDTAKGASPEILANLFRSFYSRRLGGIGLGLAFCKKIMKSFGGEITVDSIEGEYMEFALSFPQLKLK